MHYQDKNTSTYLVVQKSLLPEDVTTSTHHEEVKLFFKEENRSILVERDGKRVGEGGQGSSSAMMATRGKGTRRASEFCWEK
ncbi:hypothetical protein L6452_00905 [Arctium lappa]|uniref:Uncharacterized protein n=1 Tax=Arctium lappa TaxID=4217 RepID=A0ACB9FFF4_ARCLA|nr:hypothetical protein L6452_00905 [Arctium lappa]